MKPVPIFINKRVVGKAQNGVFSKTGEIFLQRDAIGIEQHIIPILQDYNVHTMRVKSRCGLIYEISLAEFLSHAELVTENWGSRLFCSREHFRELGAEQMKLAL